MPLGQPVQVLEQVVVLLVFLNHLAVFDLETVFAECQPLELLIEPLERIDALLHRGADGQRKMRAEGIVEILLGSPQLAGVVENAHLVEPFEHGRDLTPGGRYSTIGLPLVLPLRRLARLEVDPLIERGRQEIVCLQFPLERFALLAVQAGLLPSPPVERRGGLLLGGLPGAPVKLDRIEVRIEPDQFSHAGVDPPHAVLAISEARLSGSDVVLQTARPARRFTRRA